MLCRSIANLISVKVQCCECLCVGNKMNMREMEIGWELPYYFVRHQQDGVPQYLRSYCREDSVWWMSMFREKDEYERDENRIRIAFLFGKAVVRYCAPVCRILFFARCFDEFRKVHRVLSGFSLLSEISRNLGRFCSIFHIFVKSCLNFKWSLESL